MAGNNQTPPGDEPLLAAMSDLLRQLWSEPRVRGHLRRFAERLLAELPEETAAPVVVEADPDATVLDMPVVSRAEPPPVQEPVVTSDEAVRQLKWAQPTGSRLTPAEREVVAGRAAEPTGRPVTWRSVPDTELRQIPARARLKAEACRWKNERRRLLEAGRRFAEEIEPLDHALIARAKALPDCFLWMNWHEGPTLGAVAAWDIVAECFETLAAIVELLEPATEAADAFPDLLREALELAAESQSALRAAVRGVDYEDENEQDRSYNWLKRVAAERGQFIERFMRADDPADPTQSAARRARIADLAQRMEARRGQDKLRRKRIGQVKYLAGEIAGDQQADHVYHWERLIASIEELVAAGEPPSSKELRGYLLPIFEEFPAGDLPPHVARVLHEIDRFLGENPHEEPAPTETRTSPEIEEVARRLEGRTMVLIGGVRKPGHVQALLSAFRLKKVEWVPTREHQSVSKFEPFVRQPDVAVVVLAIRWTSHSYGEVKEFCDLYGKPFVRLKAGYNPAQVATHILEQVSDQLPATVTPSESA
jgi:hypothetical protein